MVRSYCVFTIICRMHHSSLYQSVLSVFLYAPSFFAQTTAQSFPLRQGQCKPIPGDARWPSNAEWATLNSTIQGRLLQPAPPAAACHPGRPEFNSIACDAVKKGFADSDWHAQDPVSNMWQNWNNYSCTPMVEGGCSGIGYPIFVVAAREAEDVAEAVKFARRTGVRLNIKSTGHDFLLVEAIPFVVVVVLTFCTEDVLSSLIRCLFGQGD